MAVTGDRPGWKGRSDGALLLALVRPRLCHPPQLVALQGTGIGAGTAGCWRVTLNRPVQIV